MKTFGALVCFFGALLLCFAAVSEVPHFLVITSEELEPAFSGLLDYRANHGFTVESISVADIEAGYAGRDTQEKIRNCVIAMLGSHPMLYVMLGGDDTAVPVRFVYPKGLDNIEPEMVSDLYYVDADGGTWDLNGDDIFGEPEDMTVEALTAEAYVGRVPIRTADEAVAYAQKVARYEAAADDEDFVGSTLMTGGNPKVSGDDRAAGMNYHDPVCDGEVNLFARYPVFYQPLRHLYPVHCLFSAYTSWDSEYCGDYEWSADNLCEQWNNRSYNYVFRKGHGNGTGWFSEVPGFNRDAVMTLTNEIPGIVHSGGCGNGIFHHAIDPGISEAFIRNTHGGAVAVTGHTGSIVANYNLEEFMEEVLSGDWETFGEAYVAAIAKMAPERIAGNIGPLIKFSYQGDPALPILVPLPGRRLQLMVPKGCEVIRLGDTVNIRWNAAGTGFVDGDVLQLEVSSDAGASWAGVPGAAALPCHDGVFAWDTSGLAISDRYRLRLSTTSGEPVSTQSGDFTIAPTAWVQVRSVPIVDLRLDGSLGADTNYDITTAMGYPFSIVAPDSPPLTFVGWFDKNDDLITDSHTYSSICTREMWLTAKYEYLGAATDTTYYLNDGTAEGEWAVGDDANDGLSPQTPVRSFAALTAMYGNLGWGDRVLYAPGTFTELLELSWQNEGLQIQGSGTDATFFDGGGTQRCMSLDNCGWLSVSSLTLSHGASEVDGGAVYASKSHLIVSDCVLAFNSARRGGAIALSGEFPSTFYGCTFQGNTSESDGGALHASNAEISLTDCDFVANDAYRGGGVALDGFYSATFSNCTFQDNAAEGPGGAVRIDGPEAIFTGSTFSGNASTSDAAGALRVLASPVTLRRCEFTDNIASAAGGAIFSAEQSDLTIARCYFQGNISETARGGAMTLLNGATTNCSMSVFVGNSAATQGGALAFRGTVDAQLDHCTIAGNSADKGAGIHTHLDGVLQMTRSIAVDNTAVTSDDNLQLLSAQPATITYSLTDGSVSGPGNITGNAAFVSAASGDCHLTAASAAVDAAPATVERGVDLDGNPWPLDGNGDGERKPDLGAYEYVSALADSDLDGLSDEEEIDYYDTNALLADTDGDGSGDGAEVEAGTDPKDASSHPQNPDGMPLADLTAVFLAVLLLAGSVVAIRKA